MLRCMGSSVSSWPAAILARLGRSGIWASARNAFVLIIGRLPARLSLKSRGSIAFGVSHPVRGSRFMTATGSLPANLSAVPPAGPAEAALGALSRSARAIPELNASPAVSCGPKWAAATISIYKSTPWAWPKAPALIVARLISR